MRQVIVDEWSVVAYTDRRLSASAAEQLRHRIDHELAAAIERMSTAFDPHITLRVER